MVLGGAWWRKPSQLQSPKAQKRKKLPFDFQFLNAKEQDQFHFQGNSNSTLKEIHYTDHENLQQQRKRKEEQEIELESCEHEKFTCLVSIHLKPQKHLKEGKFIVVSLPGAIFSTILAASSFSRAFSSKEKREVLTPCFVKVEPLYEGANILSQEPQHEQESWDVYKFHLPEIFHDEEGHTCIFSYQIRP